MSSLTREQLGYLKQHGIEAGEAFDASGMKRAEYRSRMKAEGKFVAYGVTECKTGHALRDRNGNCIQCDSARIAFARRGALPGYVYLARSDDLDLFKIGFSSDDPDNRIYIANLEGYGGARDWRICLAVRSERAGAVEIAVHRSLSGYRAVRRWSRNGSFVVSRELFDCDLDEAIGAMIEHLTFREFQMIDYR